mmetsp:Transcript_1952/g.6490  ORF Transcript_1952/g.6490 Transcript_1952/m.6490 type:complete len:225 (-) Transcript_1952:284-958(-)
MRVQLLALPRHVPEGLSQPGARRARDRPLALAHGAVPLPVGAAAASRAAGAGLGPLPLHLLLSRPRRTTTAAARRHRRCRRRPCFRRRATHPVPVYGVAWSGSRHQGRGCTRHDCVNAGPKPDGGVWPSSASGCGCCPLLHHRALGPVHRPARAPCAGGDRRGGAGHVRQHRSRPRRARVPQGGHVCRAAGAAAHHRDGSRHATGLHLAPAPSKGVVPLGPRPA